MCARNKVAHHISPRVNPIEVPPERFDHVRVDIVGPFPPDRGFTHISTAIDRTTRWPEAIPLKDTKAETVARAFIDVWVARFGVPKIVTSDWGAQFTSEAWSKSLERLGIMATTMTAYHPQANGLIERFHRTLKNALRCVATDSSWARCLSWVLLGLRSAPKDDTSTSAAEILYGTMLRIPGMCFPDWPTRTQTAQAQLEVARKNVEAFTPAILNKKKFSQSPFVPRNIKDAQYMFIRVDNLVKPPLAPCYTGSFKVLEKNFNNSTKIQLPRGQDNISLSRLKAETLASS